MTSHPARGRRFPRAAGAVATASMLLLTACSSASGSGTSAGDAPEGFPVTVENCGTELTFDKAPERVVLLKSASVPYLDELGLLDKVVSRAGVYPRDYFDDETWEQIEAIPSLTDRVDASGHLQLSKESVLELEPDLVLGVADNLDHASLGAVGIPVIEEPVLCAESSTVTPSFDSLYDQLALYGKVFGVPEVAAERTAALRAEVEALVSASAPSGEKRTAAVLYPTVGGGVTYAYGTGSMAHPQLEAAGFTNVYADVDERVFEVTVEDLLGRNPDVLILLHTDGDPADVEAAVRALPGSSQLRAVAEDQMLTLLFNFTEPPSPLALEGLRRIVERFGESS
jgi:iron complex transport system substrate-binding protein